MSLTLTQWEARLATLAVTFTLQYGVPAVTDTSRVLKHRAKEQVPFLTGRLSDSIMEQQPEFDSRSASQEITAGGVTIRGVFVDYAWYQEAGTVHIAPRAYMRTAMFDTVPVFRRNAAAAAVKSLI
jgi:hypothetical protein